MKFIFLAAILGFSSPTYEQIKLFIRKLFFLNYIPKVFLNEILKISEDDYIIDIGGNFGLFSRDILKYKKNQNLIIYEPISDCQKTLRNLSKKIIIRKLALSDCYDVKKFYIPTIRNFNLFSLASLQSELIYEWFLLNAKFMLKFVCIKEILISISTLDEDYYSLNNFQHKIRLIKIDVQGLEENVILGALKIINDHKPDILVEHELGNFSRVIDILSINGYELIHQNSFDYYYRHIDNI